MKPQRGKHFTVSMLLESQNDIYTFKLMSICGFSWWNTVHNSEHVLNHATLSQQWLWGVMQHTLVDCSRVTEEPSASSTSCPEDTERLNDISNTLKSQFKWISTLQTWNVLRRQPRFFRVPWGGGGERDWVHLVCRLLFGLLYHTQMMGVAQSVEWLAGGNQSTWRKYLQVLFCPPQIPYGLIQAWTCAAKVECQQLPVCATAWPYIHIFTTILNRSDETISLNSATT
jgi:hypothetical protein